MSLEQGQLLENRYRIVRAIKTGGMGAVYEAHDTRLDDEPVALKEMLDFSYEEDAAFIRSKFQEEKRLLSRLNFPGIPRVRDFFMVERICYIVMDLVSGTNLEQEIADRFTLARNPPTLAEIVDTGVQALGILEHLHRLDPPLVHRDVKPGNLIRDHLGKIWLVDFGLAMNFTGTARSEVGTLGYAPLEQIAGQAEPRSDLFGLGATLFHFATGKVPVAFSIPPFRDVAPTAPPGLAEFIDRSVRNKPDERFANAREMADALQALLIPAAPTAPLPVSAPPTARMEPEPAAPKKGKLGIALVTLIVGGSIVLGGISRHHRQPRANHSAVPTHSSSPSPIEMPSAQEPKPAFWTAQDQDQPGLPGAVGKLSDGTEAFIPSDWQTGTHTTDKKVEFPFIRQQKGTDWAEVNWLDRGCLLPAHKALENDVKKWAERFSGEILGSRSDDVVVYDITYKVPDSGRKSFAQLLYRMPEGRNGHKLSVAHLMTVNPQAYPFWQLRALALSRK